jgi:hypothetical protein
VKLVLGSLRGAARVRVAGVLGGALVVTLAAGCGGEDAGRVKDSGDLTLVEKQQNNQLVDPGTRPFDCRQDDGLDFLLLDDFETGAAAGGWFANNDVCEACQEFINEQDRLKKLDPPPPDLAAQLAAAAGELAKCRPACDRAAQPNLFLKPLPTETIPGGRCLVAPEASAEEKAQQSRQAFHLLMGPLTDWGGSLSFDLPGLSVSDYEGVAFWARVGPGGRSTVRVEISDRFTNDKLATAVLDWNASAEGQASPKQAFCEPEQPEDELSNACDKWGSYAVMSSDWRFFKLPFSEFRQKGYGRRAPYLETFRDPDQNPGGALANLDKAQGVLSVGFMFEVGSWNVWIDDVGFYRTKKETTP